MDQLKPDPISRIRPALARRRMIHTVATGRCGTAYLSHVLEFLPGVESVHEPEPAYHEVLRPALDTGQGFLEFLVDHKLPAIAAGTLPVYAEASHLFCKGFVEPFLDLGLRSDLVLLSRDRAAVASSLFRSGTIPGRTPKGLQFYLSPVDPVFLPLPGWEDLHDYQLCLWYILEIERRAKHYAESFRGLGCRVVEIRLEELRTVAGFRRLYRELGLRGPGPRKWLAYFRWGRTAVNTIDPKKKDRPLPENIPALEQALFERLGLAENR